MADALPWLGVLVGILLIFGTAAWASLSAAPWLPTRSRDVERMLRAAEVKRGDRVYDLGCGDGRLVFAAAERYGTDAVGFEISLLPYLVARLRAFFAHRGSRAQVRLADFFQASLTDADVVVCFLTPAAMEKLRTKFVRELRPGTRVVSYNFRIHGGPHERKDKPAPTDMTVWSYRW